MLVSIQRKKREVPRSCPLRIGDFGFVRIGQSISCTLSNRGKVIVMSWSYYTDISNDMGFKYTSLSDPASFLKEGLDLILFAVSILSFETTIRYFAPHIESYISKSRRTLGGPLIVDVLSVKEHPRKVLLELLPKECDILCTHPMFGPDSGKNGWHGLNFVYERTRIDGGILNPTNKFSHQMTETFADSTHLIEFMRTPRHTLRSKFVWSAS